MKTAMNQSLAAARGLNTTMNKVFLIFVLCLVIPLLARAQGGPLNPSYLPAIDTNPADYPSNIWVTDTMQKVQQRTGSPGTAHWGTFYGTQGEFVDFQVHIAAPVGGYASLTISSSNFVQTSPSSFTISAASRDIVVYREAYHTLPHITNNTAAYYNTLGPLPDALIPAVDPYFNQTTNAFPTAVTANYNQSAWIDVFIPQNAPSGYYLGSITVSNSGTTLATLPIIVAVWQWPASHGGHMPATSSLATNFQSGYQDFCAYEAYGAQGNNTNCGHYPPAAGNLGNGQEIGQMAGGVMFLDHRISAFNGYQSYLGNGASDYAVWLQGTNNSPYLNTIIPGAKITEMKRNGGSVSTFASNYSPFRSYGVLPTDEVCDEPSSATVSSSCVPAATTAHATTPVTPVEMPGTYANISGGGGLNAVDFWAVEQSSMWNASADTDSSAQYKAWVNGAPNPDGIPRQLWSYESCSSSGTCGNGTTGYNYVRFPNDNIDGTAAANRAMEWATFQNGQTGELSFAVTCMWESIASGGNCPSGQATTTDPWTSVYLFGNNGDGTLVYASTYGGTVHHVTQQGGAPLVTEIWIPSIRLKLKRDGFQDYEYLKVLTTLGQGNYVNTQVSSFMTNLNNYDYTGANLQTARQNLGARLHQLTYPVALEPPPSLTGTVQ